MMLQTALNPAVIRMANQVHYKKKRLLSQIYLLKRLWFYVFLSPTRVLCSWGRDQFQTTTHLIKKAKFLCTALLSLVLFKPHESFSTGGAAHKVNWINLTANLQKRSHSYLLDPIIQLVKISLKTTCVYLCIYQFRSRRNFVLKSVMRVLRLVFLLILCKLQCTGAKLRLANPSRRARRGLATGIGLLNKDLG